MVAKSKLVVFGLLVIASAAAVAVNKFNISIFRAPAADSTAQLASDIKNHGCIWSGLVDVGDYFTAEPNFNEYVSLLKRSGCKYLHRTVETWTHPPDFTKIQNNIQRIRQVTGKEYIYEMMIAEAISTNTVYFYPDENRNFNFSAMCRDGLADNYWGPNTCRPSFYQQEYRKYISYITRRGLESGISVFMFGEIPHQDDKWWTTPKPPITGIEIAASMRNIATSLNKPIIVGAQIVPAGLNEEQVSLNYVSAFDYILTGLDPIAIGAPLPYGPNVKNAAKMILLMPDWDNTINDGPHQFTRLSRILRAQFIQDISSRTKNTRYGFIMPFRMPLAGPRQGTECSGPNEFTYSSSNQYGCKDEDFLNIALLQSTNSRNGQCLVTTVPTTMIAGEVRNVTVSIKNTGDLAWTRPEYKLAAIPQSGNPYLDPININMVSDAIYPGEIATFQFQVTAPQTPGNYSGMYKLYMQNIAAFGDSCGQSLVVVTSAPAQNVNGASFINQNVPATMVAGEQYNVSLTFKNSGTKIWDKIGTPGNYGQSYRIKSQNPPDNLNWGINYVPIPSAPIRSGENATFSLRITAPTVPGTYNFQWRMNQGLVGWFGESSPNIRVQVIPH